MKNKYFQKMLHSSGSTWDRPIVLIGILLFFIGIWSIQPKVHIDSDPGAYSLLAHKMSTLEFFSEPGSHIFTHRVGLTLPTGIVYRAFGVNQWTTNLWPLVCSLIAIVLVWFAAPQGTPRPLSALLIAANPLQVRYSAILFPDIVAATFMFSSCFFLQHRTSAWATRNIRNALIVSAAAVFSCLVAFLAKASAYWVLPFWLGVFAIDLRNRRIETLKSFYLPCAIWAIIGAAAYLMFCWIMWGSPFSRLDALERIAERHLWLLNNTSELLVARLTSDAMIFLNRFAIPIFAASVACLVVHMPKMLFWKGYFLINLVLWWFGSVSFTHYNPLPLYARFALPLLPAMALLGGCVLSQIRIRKSFRSILLASLFFVGTILMLSANAKTLVNQSDLTEAQTQTVLIAFIFIVIFVIARHLKYHWVNGLIQTICAIGFSGAQLLFAAPDPKAESEKIEHISIELLKEQLKSRNEAAILMTADIRSPKLLAYHFEYQYPANLTVVPFAKKHFQKSIKAGRSVYFFINKKRSRRQHRVRKHENHTRTMMKLVKQRRESERIFQKESIVLTYFPGK